MKTIDAELHIQELELENIQLKKGIEELSVLNDIAIAIGSTLSLEKIIELIVRKCIKHFDVEQGAVLLLDNTDPETPFHTVIRRADHSDNVLPFRLNTQITGWMIKNKNPLIVNNLFDDDRFTVESEEDCPICSILSVPLLLKGSMTGLICLFNKKDPYGFNEDDKLLLTIIGTESAQILENARLFGEEQEYIKIREELRLATDIQLDLLPSSMPEIPGYDISAINIPALKVSGDYFDFITIDESEIAFCLGDVSGKGMPAALLMANLQATLRGQVQFSNSPKDCIRCSNALLYRSTGLEKFATLFYGKINTERNELTLCNAGHDAPLFLTVEDEIVRPETGGLVLGFLPVCEYDEETMPIRKGEILLIYTDGITEAMNENEEEFGVSRLIQVLRQNKNSSSNGIIDEIINSVQRFTGDVPQMDDMTLLIVKREK